MTSVLGKLIQLTLDSDEELERFDQQPQLTAQLGDRTELHVPWQFGCLENIEYFPNIQIARVHVADNSTM